MNGGWVIVLTVLIAWALALLPMPGWAAPFRPEWTLIVLVYWAMALPSRVSIGWCWLAGLGLDVLMGTLLGQHALALALVGWVVARMHLQVRVYPEWQQALVLVALVGMYEFVLFWTDGISGTRSEVRWGPVLTTALLWPWALVLLRRVRRRFNVT
ncbi:MAG: rod shape-determining protein MreD [Xanthomonadaceae bacterium]|nr:rod shape-determining protein MreD [Xanthomonadaceae bacterium]